MQLFRVRRGGWVWLPMVGLVAALVAPAAATPAASPQVRWTKQFGTPSYEDGVSVANAGSAAYIAGTTGGNLAKASLGASDAFLRRYNADGSTAWTRQFGTGQDDSAQGVATAGDRVYLVGTTGGQFNGQTAVGSTDVFVTAFSASGTRQWTHQFGSSSIDSATAVAAVGDAVYVAGTTQGVIPGGVSAGGAGDSFIRKYSAAGDDIKWTKQIGTVSSDFIAGMFVTPAAVYVAGTTNGPLGGEPAPSSIDAFVQKYTPAGELVWTRIFGSDQVEYALGLAGDSTGIYVVGQTDGAMEGSWGSTDGFIRKYSHGGEERWTRQVGTGVFDVLTDVAASGGSVHVGGRVGAALAGQQHRGGFDAVVRRYDTRGRPVWTRQFGTEAFDSVGGLATGRSGTFVGGITGGALAGPSAGENDAYLRRYVSYRPDALLSRSRSTGYVGGDVYNDSASRQTLREGAGAGMRRTFFVRAANDGETADTYRVAGCKSGGGFTVKYLAGAAGDTTITDQVVGGTYRWRGVAPGAQRTLRMVIGVTQQAEVGRVKSCLVSISSVGQPTKVDAVRGRVEATP